jgi:hypothetical protein
VKLKKNVNYCLTCFLMLKHLKSNWNCCINILTNKTWTTFLFCKIALESFIKPFQWLMLKNKFVSIIQQLRN